MQPRLVRSRLHRPRRWTAGFAIGIGLLAAGCSIDRYYADAEQALGTTGYFHALDHIAVYYPSGIALNFPGYIVGFEETTRRRASNGRDDVHIDTRAHTAGYTARRLLKTLNYHVPVVSHVLRYEGRPFGEGNCALYSLYQNHGAALMDYCEDGAPPSGSPETYRSAFRNGWHAIDLLGRRLADDVRDGDHTHLVVAIMGLDTAQEEAIRNYKSIMWSIRRSGGSDFRPLFVGITWSSFFASRWFDPLWEAIAYPPIADRADILGFTWLGVLLQEAVLPLGDTIRISVIGHSFGARAASMALCVPLGIRRAPGARPITDGAAQVTDFVGLSPAFSLRRFADRDDLLYENLYYRDYCPRIRRFVFTASDNDAAYAPLFWTDMVGDPEVRARFCARPQPVSVSCTAARSDGSIAAADAPAKIHYIDTSALMRFGVPGTEGGAHSDIYRPQVGHLIWRLIDGPAH